VSAGLDRKPHNICSTGLSVCKFGRIDHILRNGFDGRTQYFRVRVVCIGLAMHVGREVVEELPSLVGVHLDAFRDVVCRAYEAS